MNLGQKHLGYLLIGLGFFLLVLLGILKANFDREGIYLCDLISKYPDLDMSDCPAHKSSNSWIIAIAFGISFVVLSTGAYLLILPLGQATLKKVDLSKLDERERKIYEIIRAKGGSVYQSDLLKETGFSKVQLTRTLDKLETKKIIERKRRGMTNLVVLK